MRSALAIRSAPLAKGEQGLAQLVGSITDAIRRGARHPDVRAEALRIVERVPPQDYAGEIAAVWDHCVLRAGAPPYRLNPVDVQEIAGAHLAPNSRGLDCKGFSVWCGALLESLGHPVRVKIVDQRKQQPGQAPNFHHVYVEVFDRSTGRWRAFDPVIQPKNHGAGPGDEPRHGAARRYALDGFGESAGRSEGSAELGFITIPRWLDPTISDSPARAVLNLIPGGSSVVSAADTVAAARINAGIGTGSGSSSSGGGSSSSAVAPSADINAPEANRRAQIDVWMAEAGMRGTSDQGGASNLSGGGISHYARKTWVENGPADVRHRIYTAGAIYALDRRPSYTNSEFDALRLAVPVGSPPAAFVSTLQAMRGGHQQPGPVPAMVPATALPMFPQQVAAAARGVPTVAIVGGVAVVAGIGAVLLLRGGRRSNPRRRRRSSRR